MMRLILVHLISLAMLIVPMRAWVGLAGCRCAGNDAPLVDAGEGAAASSDACCAPMRMAQPRSSGQMDRGEDTASDDAPTQAPGKAPCDENDCPSACCTGVVGSSFVLPLQPSMIVLYADGPSGMPADARAHASPHLLRLKRPPRSV